MPLLTELLCFISNDSIQTIAALLGSTAAIIAAVFAGRAYFATIDQVGHAKTQAEAATEQLNILREQRKEERADRAREIEQHKLERIAEFKRLYALDDTQRARFRVVSMVRAGSGNSPILQVVLKNFGISAARHLTIRAEDGRELASNRHIDAGGDFTFKINEFDFNSKVLVAQFDSSMGSRWTMNLSYPDSASSMDLLESHIQVRAPYDLDKSPIGRENIA